MIDLIEDIHPLAEFQRNSSVFIEQIRKTGRPLVLTVDGKAEAVVLDANTYMDVADHLDMIASLRRGLDQASRGEGRLVDDVFNDLEREFE